MHLMTVIGKINYLINFFSNLGRIYHASDLIVANKIGDRLKPLSKSLFVVEGREESKLGLLLRDRQEIPLSRSHTYQNALSKYDKGMKSWSS